MHTYVCRVHTGPASYQDVDVRADSDYHARQIAVATYSGCKVSNVTRK